MLEDSCSGWCADSQMMPVKRPSPDAYPYHDLPYGLAARQPGDRLAAVGELIAAVDMRADPNDDDRKDDGAVRSYDLGGSRPLFFRGAGKMRLGVGAGRRCDAFAADQRSDRCRFCNGALDKVMSARFWTGASS